MSWPNHYTKHIAPNFSTFVFLSMPECLTLIKDLEGLFCTCLCKMQDGWISDLN